MKNVYVLLTCLIFTSVVIFSGHFAQCQYYPVDSSVEEGVPLTPELYGEDQNQGEVITHFDGVTIGILPSAACTRYANLGRAPQFAHLYWSPCSQQLKARPLGLPRYRPLSALEYSVRLLVIFLILSEPFIIPSSDCTIFSFDLL